ncbi:MAG: tetratricopeptide repeat protein [Planctomycetes bacterium]|nr:tetratricopeptide repeat protein [Planctomycetota bacterium]
MKTNPRQAALVPLAQAKTAFEAGMPREALDRLRVALAADPSSREGRLLLARVHLSMDDPRAAMRSLDALDLYDPTRRDEPERRFLRLEALARAGMDDIVVPALRSAAEDFPDDPRPHRLLAQVQQRLGKVADAVVTLRRVLKLEPSDRALRVTLANLEEANDPNAAIDALKPAAQDQGSRRWLARLYYRVNRLREATDLYDALTGPEMEDPSLWREAGRVYADQGDILAATARLTRAIDSSRGTDTESMTELARLCMQGGDFTTAGRWWWRLTRRDAKADAAWAGLAVCALAMGRWTLALRALRPLSIQTSRSERQILLAKAWINASSGVAIRRAAQRTEPTLTVHHQGHLDRLLAASAGVFERHLAQFPERADSHYHLAVCRKTLGDDAAAELQLCDALVINPRYEAAKRLSHQINATRRAA